MTEIQTYTLITVMVGRMFVILYLRKKEKVTRNLSNF